MQSAPFMTTNEKDMEQHDCPEVISRGHRFADDSLDGRHEEFCADTAILERKYYSNGVLLSENSYSVSEERIGSVRDDFVNWREITDLVELVPEKSEDSENDEDMEQECHNSTKKREERSGSSKNDED